MARAFVAVVPPADVLDAIVVARDALPPLDGLRLVAREQLHLTIAFLGDDADLDAVTRALTGGPLAGGPFVLSLRGVGAFPRPRSARVLWSGICRGRRELTALAANVDARLAHGGVAHARDEPFRPHVTLARRRPPFDASAIVHRDGAEITWTVDRVVLFESTLGPDGARHRAHAELRW